MCGKECRLMYLTDCTSQLLTPITKKNSIDIINSGHNQKMVTMINFIINLIEGLDTQIKFSDFNKSLVKS